MRAKQAFAIRKAERTKRISARAKKARAARKAKFKSPLELVLRHVDWLLRRKHPDHEIRALLEELGLSEIAIKVIMHQMRLRRSALRQLVEHINKEIRAGHPVEHIRQRLIRAGWWPELVKFALGER